MEWQERDGPAVKPPEEEGFGTTLIQRACEYELKGEATLIYDPAGLTCDIRFALV